MTATKGRPAVWQAKKDAAPARMGKTHGIYHDRALYAYLLTFTLVPVVIAMFFQFTYYNILQPPQWVGWVNCQAVL